MKKEQALFSKAANQITNQIGADGFILPLLHQSDELILMRMVYKLSKRWPWSEHKYKTSDFTLGDILQDNPQLNLGGNERVFGPYQGTYEYENTGSMRAKFTKMVSARLEGRGSGELNVSSVKVKKETVNVGKLPKKHRCNMDHELVRKVQNAKKMPKCPYVLAMLTERVVTTTDNWEISENRHRMGGGGFTVKNKMIGVEDTVDARVQKVKTHSMTIGAGTVLAYGVRELNIRDSGDLDFPDPWDHGSDIESDSIFDEDHDLSELQNPEEYLSPLAELPRSTRSALFQMFCEVMKDRDALSDVENTLEEWCAGFAPVVTEQNASASQSSSASAILDLLRCDPDSHMESEGPGSLLTAAYLLVSAMEALPDEALSLLSESSPDVLKAYNALFLDLKDQKKSSPLPLESLPLPLRELLSAERENNVLPLVLRVTVQGLSYLCDQ